MPEQVPGLARYERAVAHHDAVVEWAADNGYDPDDPNFDLDAASDDFDAASEPDEGPDPYSDAPGDYGRYI